MLYDAAWQQLAATGKPSLNAPFGARCFMTFEISNMEELYDLGLNAPFGARCFMTCWC